jgi:hypothetical protein
LETYGLIMASFNLVNSQIRTLITPRVYAFLTIQTINREYSPLISSNQLLFVVDYDPAM